MKKIFLFLLCTMALFANAQQADSLKVESEKKCCGIKTKIGFMLNPQGVVIFEKKSEIGYEIPTFLIFSVEQDNISLTPFYSLLTNGFGGFIEYKLKENIASYVVMSQNKKEDDYYMGIGGSIKTEEKFASVFVELGYSFKKEKPLISAGVAIPLCFILN
ncbi:MAG: hypothetical protein WCX46_00640 [Candidatus Paceibacterota bacterium]